MRHTHVLRGPFDSLREWLRRRRPERPGDFPAGREQDISRSAHILTGHSGEGSDVLTLTSLSSSYRSSVSSPTVPPPRSAELVDAPAP